MATTRQPKAAAKTKAPKAPKVPPTVEAVAVRVTSLSAPEEPPTLWKEADLKRRLTATEKPVLAAALVRLQEQRQVLTLRQGKTALHLFAEPLRAWLAEPAPVPVTVDLFDVYTRLVRQSGGYPDVKIAALREALDPASAATLPERLTALWREGRATFGQGDWSLADDASRAAAVELNGERYLLVRLDE